MDMLIRFSKQPCKVGAISTRITQIRKLKLSIDKVIRPQITKPAKQWCQRLKLESLSPGFLSSSDPVSLHPLHAVPLLTGTPVALHTEEPQTTKETATRVELMMKSLRTN